MENMTRERMSIINQFSDEILELVDNQEEQTRSDIQGGAMAIVMRILAAAKKLK
jgi:hypothetical protein